jgi:hypothetical protein
MPRNLLNNPIFAPPDGYRRSFCGYQIAFRRPCVDVDERPEAPRSAPSATWWLA